MAVALISLENCCIDIDILYSNNHSRSRRKLTKQQFTYVMCFFFSPAQQINPCLIRTNYKPKISSALIKPY